MTPLPIFAATSRVESARVLRSSESKLTELVACDCLTKKEAGPCQVRRMENQPGSPLVRTL
jgi:hypothetical protein